MTCSTHAMFEFAIIVMFAIDIMSSTHPHHHFEIYFGMFFQFPKLELCFRKTTKWLVGRLTLTPRI